jgi:hypothetical protein
VKKEELLHFLYFMAENHKKVDGETCNNKREFAVLTAVARKSTAFWDVMP